MKKRVLASILAGVLTVGVLTGCGSKTEEAADTTATEETTEDAAEDTAAAVLPPGVLLQLRSA